MPLLPTRITPCPIVGAVAELRFTTDIPGDALLGLLFADLQEDYPETGRHEIMSMPQEVLHESRLRFASHYFLKGNDYVVNIGPHVFSVATQGSYHGWSAFQQRILKAFGHFLQRVPCRLQRLGLRYTDFFPGDVLGRTKLSLALGNRFLLGPETQIRTLIEHAGFSHILQFTNKALRPDGRTGIETRGTIIDVDTLHQPEKELVLKEPSALEGILSRAHQAGKELFFETLSDEFLATLNPEYPPS